MFVFAASDVMMMALGWMQSERPGATLVMIMGGGQAVVWVANDMTRECLEGKLRDCANGREVTVSDTFQPRLVPDWPEEMVRGAQALPAFAH